MVRRGRRFESVRGLCKSAGNRCLRVQIDLLCVERAVDMEPFMELSRSERNSSLGSEQRETTNFRLRITPEGPDLACAKRATMFTLPVDLTFARSNPVLHAGFVEIRTALAPMAGDRDVDTFTEVFWSAPHGLATLSRAGRLRPEFYDQRMSMLVDQFST